MALESLHEFQFNWGTMISTVPRGAGIRSERLRLGILVLVAHDFGDPKDLGSARPEVDEKRRQPKPGGHVVLWASFSGQEAKQRVASQRGHTSGIEAMFSMYRALKPWKGVAPLYLRRPHSPRPQCPTKVFAMLFPSEVTNVPHRPEHPTPKGRAGLDAI